MEKGCSEIPSMIPLDSLGRSAKRHIQSCQRGGVHGVHPSIRREESQLQSAIRRLDLEWPLLVQKQNGCFWYKIGLLA